MATTKTSIRFGRFDVDLQTATILKQGRPVRIQSQPFQVLALLLSRPGELVTREELQLALWPTGTFVEYDKAINTSIKKIRQVLADSAENPRFIETVPRRGYRFIAPVEVVSASPHPDEGRSRPTLSQHNSRFGLAAFALAVIGAIAIVVFAPRDAGLEIYMPVPLTAFPGNERDPSLSPDGEYVVFAWDKGGEPTAKLYLKRVGSDDLRQLTTGEGDDRSPVWSPDGRLIAFVRFTPTRMSVWVADADGGRPRQLLSSPAWPDVPLSYRMCFLAWTADSRWLVAPENRENAQGLGLTAVSVTSAERRILTRPSAQWIADINPALSPDAKTLHFVRLASMGAGDLHALPIGQDLRPVTYPQRILTGSGWIGNLVWADAKTLVFPMIARQGTWRIYRLDRSRSEHPEVLSSLGEDARYVSISTRAKKLVFARADDRFELRRIDSSVRATRAPAYKPRSDVLITEGNYLMGQYSPDGRRLVFRSQRSGVPAVWLSDVDGSNAVRLTSFKVRTLGYPSWSPDGRWIVFHARVNPQGDIYKVDVDGHNLKQLTDNEEEDVVPRWSRDGRSIYFASRRTGQYQIWRVGANGGGEIQVTSGGGIYATESDDGRRLYFSRYGGSDLWSLPLESGVPGREEQIGQVALANDSSWDLTAGRLWFIGRVPGNPEQSLNVLRFSTGVIERIAPVPGEVSFGLSVAPDERSVMYTRMDRQRSDLMLVERFP